VYRNCLGLGSLPVDISLYSGGAERPGCPSPQMAMATGLLRPTWQSGVSISATTDSDGNPNITWNKGANAPVGTSIQFFRVYRSAGAGVTNPAFTARIDTTPDATAPQTYVDTNGPANCTAAARCTYSITAVDTNWQESDPIAVNWP
jgi:hypothetical protein